MRSVRDTIKLRDDCSDTDVDFMFAEAAELIAECIEDGGAVDEVLLEVFGLEPDYLCDDEFARAISDGYSLHAAWKEEL